jgi:oligoribonuclease NrnB/cAMP/cGMP phosphodiesterase (DHH superfamily)
VNRFCFYHAGCPDGFGAAWATRKAWGDDARYVPRRHEHRIDADAYRDCQVAFVDIAPANDELLELARVAEQVIVLDHHVTARDRYHEDPSVANEVEDLGHEIIYDMERSGAMLSWGYFCPDEPPALLRYVQDQDLWHWQLPESREVNAAIAAYPLQFDTWDQLAARDTSELVAEGRSIVRSNNIEIERRSRAGHPLLVGGELVEAVNSTTVRSAIGHALAERKTYGVAWGCVYRVDGSEVHATLYSIGDVDVARIAAGYGGGGHRNAAGFSLSLTRWLTELVEPAR